MALFDRDQRKIILRVVYDGAERAGKTTNVAQLYSSFTSRRRSEIFAPEAIEGRTLYFDLMQLEAGLIAGYSIRCQLITVPGQSSLSRRRWQLLKSADVVVFVCESTPAGIEQARPMLSIVREYLLSLKSATVPLILQANKQDLEGALDPAGVASMFEFEPSGMVIGARAAEGVGVRETVMLAIRSAANIAEKIVLSQGIESLAGVTETGESLYRSMVESESSRERADAERISREAATRAEAEEAEREAAESAEREAAERAEAERAAREAAERAEAERAAREAAERAEAERAAREAAERAEADRAAPAAVVVSEQKEEAHRSTLGARAEVVLQAANVEPPMPRHDVGIGCIWPAATGREILRKVLAFDAPVRRDDIISRQCNRRGIESSDAILYQAGRWGLRTSLSRRFEEPDEGRAALLRLARKKMQLGRLLSPGAALSIQPEASGAVWLWSVSPWLATLEDQLDDARRGRDAAAVEKCLVAFAEGAASGLALAAKQRIILEIHPSSFTLVDEDLFYVSDDIGQGPRIATIGEAILRRCEEYSAFGSAVEAFIAAFVASLDRTVGRSMIEELGVEESFKLASERSLAANDAFTLFASLLGESV